MRAGGESVQLDVAVLKEDLFLWNGHGRESNPKLEARRAGGGWAHFRGVDAEAKMREVGLPQGHEAGVQVAPHKEEQEGNGGVVFVEDGVDDGQREIQAQEDL